MRARRTRLGPLAALLAAGALAGAPSAAAQDGRAGARELWGEYPLDVRSAPAPAAREHQPEAPDGGRRAAAPAEAAASERSGAPVLPAALVLTAIGVGLVGVAGGAAEGVMRLRSR